MKINPLLLSAAFSGLLLGGCSSNGNGDADQGEMVGQCHDLNSCAGQGDCGGKDHSCAGKNSCKGKGWKKMKKSECEEQKGNFKS